MLIKLKNIESSKEKLQLWASIYEVEDQIDNLEIVVKSYKQAFEKVCNNQNFLKVLSYVLSIGNILNGGTPKGQADGFNMDFLSKLTSIKDNTNKTLMQIICIRIKNENEEFGPMKRQFECLEEALKTPSNETKTAIEKFVKQIEGNKTTISAISLSDEFINKATKIIDEYRERIKNIDDSFKEAMAYAQKTLEYFGYPKSDSKYKKPDEFLVLINEFLNDFDKSIPVTEAKKAFKGAHVMGKKITDNKNPSLDAVLIGLKNKLG